MSSGWREKLTGAGEGVELEAAAFDFLLGGFLVGLDGALGFVRDNTKEGREEIVVVMAVEVAVE